jgi:DeoR family fructose operon transcriptional repressor
MANDGEAEKPVFVDERQQHIAELVTARGRVRLGELVERFGVSEATIRKDLTALEARLVLKRTHGGAIALRASVESELETRAVWQSEAKERIAQACLREIHDGDAIFLDSGTTIQRIAQKLVGRYLTVLTNALGVAEAVADMPTVDHLVLGGRLRRVSRSVIGALALENVDRFTVNLAFIGVSGFSEGGLTVADADEAQLKAAMIERARRVIVPIDHTKVGATHFARICELDKVDAVIIDQASTHVRDLCAAHHIELIIADGAPEQTA